MSLIRQLFCLIRLVARVGLLSAVVLVAVLGCAARPLLSPLEATATTIRPDGTVTESEARIRYRLDARADVQVDLLAPDGRTYVLRDRSTRAPDQYEIRFDGSVPIGQNVRRVVPDGAYQLRVTAENATGTRSEERIDLRVVDADTTPIEIVDLQTDLAEFTPNGDGEQDDVRITYRLTKDGEATVYATDERGNYFAIDPWQKRRAALQSHLWDGTTGGRIAGGKLLPDGRYVVHVEARDRAGNRSAAAVPVTIARGGTPRLEITEVKFTPIALILGSVLDVRVTVRNTGTTPIHSWGPAPGHTYSAPEENYATMRDPGDPGKPLFFERRGVWRIGVTWQNAPSTFPLRWGLFPPGKNPDGSDDWDRRTLEPGQSVAVEGHIRVFIKEDSRQVRFSAGVIQEGVGFPGGRVGEQMVQVGW